jgi:hypothetical protein
LFPKTQRNHMFPIRWNHPPWRNIELSGVNQALSPRTQAVVGPSGSVVPSGTRFRYSPGMSPSSQTEADRDGSVPIPCTRIQAAALRPISRKVTTGVARVGLSSR